MENNSKNLLVETEWLHKNYKNTVILDGSWYLPNQNRDAQKEYIEKHIPNALFFDIEDISDKNSQLPHMLPNENDFSLAMKSFGISNNDHIVVYDGIGMQSAARVWWTFKVFGHEKISILNGGLPKWIHEKKPITHGVEKKPLKSVEAYISKLNKKIVRNFQDVYENLESQKEQVIDARSEGRFKGIEPEPRKNLKAGHIPKSFNLPYLELLHPKNKTFLEKKDLLQIFENKGIDLKQPIITTCGSGITASIIFLALSLIDHKDISVYDGSWSEWGTKDDSLIEKIIK